MIRYGIKLWSINKNYFDKALELFKLGEIDFVEIYIVPDSFNLDELKILKEIPTVIHSPHFDHNFNIFNLDKSKIELFKNQVIKTADFLNGQFIILHAGVGKSEEIFKENAAKIYDKRILIENMPRVALDDRICFGYSLEQLKYIKKHGLDICLDFTHAIKSAVSQNLDYKKFINSLLNELKPYYFHICGGEKNKEKDEHLNLFEGDFDLKWIKKIINNLAKDKEVQLVFEVPKDKNGLENYIKNINYFKNL